MADWDKRIPPIKGNEAIINKTERPEDVMFEKIGNDKATEVQPNGIRSVVKRKPKRSQRIYFIPNKVTRVKIQQWKEKYGSRFYSAIINNAIEKHEL
jgi:hypothetical protein